MACPLVLSICLHATRSIVWIQRSKAVSRPPPDNRRPSRCRARSRYGLILATAVISRSTATRQLGLLATAARTRALKSSRAKSMVLLGSRPRALGAGFALGQAQAKNSEIQQWSIDCCISCCNTSLSVVSGYTVIISLAKKANRHMDVAHGSTCRKERFWPRAVHWGRDRPIERLDLVHQYALRSTHTHPSHQLATRSLATCRQGHFWVHSDLPLYRFAVRVADITQPGAGHRGRP